MFEHNKATGLGHYPRDKNKGENVEFAKQKYLERGKGTASGTVEGKLPQPSLREKTIGGDIKFYHFSGKKTTG